MNKNIIVYSLIFILIILIIYLFLGFRQLSSTVSDNDPQSSTSSNLSNIDLSNYYTKSDIDSSFSTKSYVDTNIHNSISTIRTDQGGNVIRPAGGQELGYEVDFDGKINFLSPVEFKKHAGFTDNVRFSGEQVHFNHHHRWINTLPKGSIIAWNRKLDGGKWGSDIPRGWAPCDGRWYKPDRDGFFNYATQADIDDGTATRSPDLRGRFVLGAGQGDGLINRELYEPGGEENVALTMGHMPVHSHEYRIRIGGPYPFLATTQWGGGGEWETHTSNKTGGCAGDNCKDWGQSHPHNNMPPYNVLTYIIKI
jgi:microcystin-dependent protein